MRPFQSLTVLGIALVLTGCAEPTTPVEPAGSGESIARAPAGLKLTGSGHHSRTVGGITELTTFSFNAIEGPNGTTGHFQYDFRANGFIVSGPITCVTSNGNQAWVGGVVDRVITDNPAFESLLGLEMWWRSIDNGEGAGAAPDSTTGLGFGFPGSVITAASWCANQNVALVLREVEGGNIQLQ
jgi:hypothetical protein